MRLGMTVVRSAPYTQCSTNLNMMDRRWEGPMVDEDWEQRQWLCSHTVYRFMGQWTTGDRQQTLWTLFIILSVCLPFICTYVRTYVRTYVCMYWGWGLNGVNPHSPLRCENISSGMAQ